MTEPVIQNRLEFFTGKSPCKKLEGRKAGPAPLHHQLKIERRKNYETEKDVGILTGIGLIG